MDKWYVVTPGTYSEMANPSISLKLNSHIHQALHITKPDCGVDRCMRNLIGDSNEKGSLLNVQQMDSEKYFTSMQCDITHALAEW